MDNEHLVEIVSLEDLDSFELVKNNLKKSNSNGINGLFIRTDENDKLASIGLVSKLTERIIIIYYLSPRNPREVDFLKDILNQRELRFYTTNGILEANLINKALNIKLADTNAKDLARLDMELGLMIDSQTQNKFVDLVTIKDIIAQSKPRLLNYIQLLNKWLPKIEHSSDSYEIDQLEKHLVDLAATMEKSYQDLIMEPSKTIFSLASRASDETKGRYDNQKDNSYTALINILTQTSRTM